MWEKLISDENIKLAIRNSSKGKRKRNDVKKIYENQDKYVQIIRKYIEDFKNDNHNPVTIYDGISRKKRTIVVPSYREQIVHHAVVQVLLPMFWKGMYEHSYGSIPERGTHKGKKTIEKWIKHDKRNVKYCLKMDIRKYFDSINHGILKRKFARVIKDKRFLNLLFKIIDVTEKGIPLGFYLSQWTSNWFLQELDHYIKEELGAKYYIRYMDDMVIFGSNKRKLHEIRGKIGKYIKRNLGLDMKKNWQVFRFDYTNKTRNYGRDLDFMGFRFFRNKTILRKTIMLKITRKALKIRKKKKETLHDARQMMSYFGYIKCTDTYRMYLDRIKPFIDFKKFRNKISRIDRRNTRCGEYPKIQTA